MKHLIVPFENRLRFQEDIILRNCLAMKLLYPHEINLIILSSIPDYIVSIAPIKEILVIEESKIQNIKIPYCSLIVNSNEHPSIYLKEKINMQVYIVPKLYTEKLSFNSKVYGNEYSLLDFKKLESNLGLKGKD